MKLLNHTSKYLAIILVPLITIWAVLFYYAMLDEIYDSLDDGLENQKILLEHRLPTNPQILDHKDLELWSHSVTNISKAYYDTFNERYADTLMYMMNEQDFEPVRIYETKITYRDKYYKVKFITSMVEEDDLIRDLITYLIVLYVSLMISIIILNNLLLKKIWQPFYSLMSQLKDFKIGSTSDIRIQNTNIEEFKLLNTSIATLINENRERYIEQQHFIENASHELQTPLAITINKIELFLENTELSDAELNNMASILDNLGRLTRLNKSLLLLSKIQNRQYGHEEVIDFGDLLQHTIAEFEDMAHHKDMKIELTEMHNFSFQMNKDLAIIMFNNLIKNAIIHGNSGSLIKIEIEPNKIIFSNEGMPKALDPKVVFSRFKKMSSDHRSTGLGLAIAKAISNKYGIQLSYQFDGHHRFILKFYA